METKKLDFSISYTTIYVSMILFLLLWFNFKFSKIDQRISKIEKRLTKFETVMIMKEVMPRELSSKKYDEIVKENK